MKKIAKKIIRAAVYSFVVLAVIAGIGFLCMIARALTSSQGSVWDALQGEGVVVMLILLVISLLPLIAWAFDE